MTLPRNCTATKAFPLLALLCVAAAAHAESVGTVTDLNGSLLVKSANGAIRVLALGSPLEQGDALVSRPGAYARVSLADRSDVTLGPDTELTIEKYSFHDTGPQGDAAVLRLDKGQVRITAGLLGRRGDDSFTLSTPSATVDVHGSTFIAGYVAPDRAGVARQGMQPQAQAQAPMPMRTASAVVAVGYTTRALYRHVSMRSFNTRAPLLLAQNIPSNGTPGGLNPGLYVQVLDGQINVTNGGGTQNFTAGQFGFTPGFQQPPVILPANPGIQFTPPPSFSSTTGSQGAGAATPGNVDCQVR